MKPKKRRRPVRYKMPGERIGPKFDLTKRRSVMYPRPAKPKYKQQFGIIVICRDEADQAKLFRKLQRDLAGRELRVVVT